MSFLKTLFGASDDESGVGGGRHKNYHEVEADSHSELGRKLGQKFGEIASEFVEDISGHRNFKRKRDQAAGLLDMSRREFPHYVEELEAYAKAAGIPIRDLWAMCIEDELHELPGEHCTTIVTNDGLLISHNEDWDDDSDESVCVLKKSIAGKTTLEFYYYTVPLGGCAFSINSHGVTHAVNSLIHTDSQMGIPQGMIGRFLSDSADPKADLARAAALQRSSGYAHTLVNLAGDVFAAEGTAKKFLAYQPDLPFAHANHYLLSELEDFEGSEDDDDYSTFERYREACRLMKPNMSMRELMEVTGNRSRGKWNSLLNCETIGRFVIDIAARDAKIWLSRESKAGWVDYPLDFLPGTNEPVA